MAGAIHVNGEALVSVSGGSTGLGALTTLGVSIDGVRIRLNEHHENVHTDTYGPGVPFDIQYFLEDAHIQLELIWYEASTLSALLQRIAGTVKGQLGAAGTLYGASASLFTCRIASPYDGVPWNFAGCVLLDAFEGKVGTRRNAWNLSIYSFPYSGASGTTAGRVHYTNV